MNLAPTNMEALQSQRTVLGGSGEFFGTPGSVYPREVFYTMNTVKVGWVGQTFALAKSSDSGGRKSRIRRSKEERKGMVESFIKKYQKANNGSFPSLSLTHKEVGGSFYTVREIVREVIQENRVLGPAMLSSEEISAEQVSEHYPLGTISIEPKSELSMSSSGSCLVTDASQSICEELVSTSSEQSTGYSRQTSDNWNYINGMSMGGEPEESNIGKPLEHGSVVAQVDDNAVFSELQVSATSSGHSASHIKQTDNGIYINGTYMGEEYKESNAGKPLEQGSVTTQVDNEPTYVEGQVCEKMDGIEDDKEAIFEKLDGVENVKEAPIAKVTPIAEGVIVETFPPKSADKPIHGNGTYFRDGTRTLKEQETEKVEVAAGNTDLLIDKIDFLEEISNGFVDEKASVNIAEPFQENLSCSTTQNGTSTLPEGIRIPVEVSQNDVSTLQIADPNKMAIGIEPKLVPAEICSQNSTGIGNTSTSGKSFSQQATSKPKADTERCQSTGEGSSTTLNRLNLESREGASKKSVKGEINPFWTVFRAFISAFVKFWSE